ncbi:MAG: DEAD/DEAH box helicase family protein [Nitrospirae bacterium]|nr:DEAD/DEAH box helicase family protein [Nitrospirota bacterium]
MHHHSDSLHSELNRLQSRLDEINQEREHIEKEIAGIQKKLVEISSATTSTPLTVLSPEEKIKLFRSLFRGREDVYPKLWVSKKTGAKGYTPVCVNEWVSSICRKPAVKCGWCDNRELAPVTDEVICRHLDGQITIGVYPLLQDETCYFLAVDFDKESWQEDTRAFVNVCRHNNIPACLERSRSGNGGHVWIFFAELVPAALARQMGIFLITETMEYGQQLDMKSYDRLFPNQDTMPKGGFGNLIALPLQKIPRESGNSVFIDDNFKPHIDQWGCLAEAKKMSLSEVQSFVSEALKTKDLMGIRTSQTDDEGPPWENQLNSRRIISKLPCIIPEKVDAVLANRLYIRTAGLPPQLLTRIKRLASFQNPEFFKKQSMRFSTALTPRVICCAEEIKAYLAIPRGCIDDLKKLLAENGSDLTIDDKRHSGQYCDFTFCGDLTDVQEKAVRELLKHSTGVFVAPPGVGKTVLGIRLIAERKTNTLVLVHRKPLLDQWRTQLASFLEMPIKEIGQIGSGKDKATNIIDVAMIQTLDKQDSVDERIKDYGHIIVDECHHISAVSFERVLMEANAKYITGLTATPYRRDGHQPIIIMQCGPVRYKISSKTQTSEAAFRQKLISKLTNFSYQWPEGDPVTVIWTVLINDEERNRMICDDVIQNLKEKRSPIILTERKEHLELLKEKLQDSVKHLVVLHGGMRAPLRKEMLSKLATVPEDEERLILATGPYIGEGFDDPRLDTLFLVMPFSFKGKMVQYAGRLHRKYAGKSEVRIYDYVDHAVPVLQKMYKKRLKAYKSLGYAETMPL